MKKRVLVYVVPFILLCLLILYRIVILFNLIPHYLGGEDAMIAMLLMIGIILFVSGIALQRLSLRLKNMSDAVESTLSADRAGELAIADLEVEDGPIRMILGIQKYLMNADTRDELLDKLLVVSTKVTGSTRASIMLYDRKSDELFVHRTIGWSAQERKVVRATRSRPGEGIAGRAFLDREPIIVNRNTAPEVDAGDKYRTRSYVSCPIVSGENTFGVLNLTEKKEPLFSENELNLIRFLVNDVGFLLRHLS
jgi:transcriptional regulator with GAF, ATPase, and Fis domain